MKDYFPHDSDARHDAKIIMLRSEYGNEGYAYYFMLIEILRNEKEYSLELKPHVVKMLVKELDLAVPKQVTDFIEYCVEIGLFVQSGDFVTSPSLLGRMTKINKYIRQKQEAAKARWEKERKKKEGKK